MFTRNLKFFSHVVKQYHALRKIKFSSFNQPVNLIPKCFKVSLLTAICQPTSSENLTNEEKLTHDFLIKQSTIQVVDSFTTLLDKITCALIDAYNEYGNILEELLYLHIERQSFIGNKFLEDQVWEKIIAIKSELDDYKRKTANLELQMTSVTNLANATAEVAFASGAEYPAIATNERIILAVQQLKIKKEGIEKLEQELIEIETKLVEITVKEFEKQNQVNDNDNETEQEIGLASN